MMHKNRITFIKGINFNLNKKKYINLIQHFLRKEKGK